MVEPSSGSSSNNDAPDDTAETSSEGNGVQSLLSKIASLESQLSSMALVSAQVILNLRLMFLSYL